MIRVLLGKQLTEIFRGYFYDTKKNKKRSAGSSIVLFVLFAFLMVGLLGGLFTVLAASICQPMTDAGMDWLYFALLGLLAVFLGVFGSVFNTHAGLYLAKDNDLLLSMPIPVHAILVARLLGVYLMGLMYSGVVLIPAVIVYLVYTPFRFVKIFGTLLLVLLVSIFVLTLSVALGWVVAKISRKLKNKSFVSVLVSLVFFGAYYYFYSRAGELIDQLVANAGAWGNQIKQTAYPVYLFGQVATGDPLAVLTVSSIILLLFFIMWMVISRSFISIVTSTGDGGTKKAYRGGTAEKTQSVSAALYKKELRRFTSSPNYMLNCGFGILLLPAGGVMLLIKGRELFRQLGEVFDTGSGVIPVILTAAVCALTLMNNMAAPSVSLEGKNIWLLQSLPVTPWQVLRAKLSVQLTLTWIPMAACLGCVAFAGTFTPAELIMTILFPVLFALLKALFDLTLGLKLANLTWTSEITPIKQSGAVALSLLGGFLYPLLYAGGFLLVGRFSGMAPYTGAFTVLTAGLCAALSVWLKKRGSELFAAL